MILNVLAVWVMFGLLFSASPAGPEIVVRRWEPMGYPPMSRLARVQGTVSITGYLTQKQGSSDYHIETGKAEGHPMLRDAAVVNIKKWLFACDGCKSPEDKAFHVTYEFRFDEGCIEPQCFKRGSTFRSGKVLVEASAPEVVTTESTK